MMPSRCCPFATRKPRTEIAKRRTDVQNRVQRADAFWFIIRELPIVQTWNRCCAGADQTNPHRRIGARRGGCVTCRKFIETKKRRGGPSSERPISQKRMQWMTKPCSVQNVSHLLRDRVFLIERNLRRGIERSLDRLQPLLFVDQISDTL